MRAARPILLSHLTCKTQVKCLPSFRAHPPRLPKENSAMKLFTYLNYGGNCEQAFRFYEKHLGGKILAMMPHSQTPGPSNVPAEWKNAIMYARMTLGETDIMGSDVPPERFQLMRSVYLSLSVGSTEEAERIYTLLSDG